MITCYLLGRESADRDAFIGRFLDEASALARSTNITQDEMDRHVAMHQNQSTRISGFVTTGARFASVDSARTASSFTRTRSESEAHGLRGVRHLQGY